MSTTSATSDSLLLAALPGNWRCWEDYVCAIDRDYYEEEHYYQRKDDADQSMIGMKEAAAAAATATGGDSYVDADSSATISHDEVASSFHQPVDTFDRLLELLDSKARTLFVAALAALEPQPAKSTTAASSSSSSSSSSLVQASTFQLIVPPAMTPRAPPPSYIRSISEDTGRDIEGAAKNNIRNSTEPQSARDTVGGSRSTPRTPRSNATTPTQSSRYPRRVCASPLKAPPGQPLPPLTFPSSKTTRHGFTPFRWENDVDSTPPPLDFIFTSVMCDHPSAKCGAATDSNEFLVGCECPDGICDANCACAKDAENQYNLNGTIKTHNSASQSLRFRECWSRCSCHCHESQTVTKETQAQIVTPAQPITVKATSKKRSRQKQTAKLAHLRQRPTDTPASSSSVPPSATTAPKTLTPIHRIIPRCFNRVVQRHPANPHLDLIVFRTLNGRGWGLKTLTQIEPNTYVAEYLGERIGEYLCEERGRRYDRNGSINYIWTPLIRPEDQIEGEREEIKLTKREKKRRKLRDAGVDIESDDESSVEAEIDDVSDSDEEGGPLILGDVNHEPRSIDALRMGHLARFINHSHGPNLRMVDVLIERRDHRFTHGALFSSRMIPPGTELTFNYGDQYGANISGWVCRCDYCEKHRRINSTSDSTTPSPISASRASRPTPSPFPPTHQRPRVRITSKSPRSTTWPDDGDDNLEDDAPSPRSSKAPLLPPLSTSRAKRSLDPALNAATRPTPRFQQQRS